MCRQEARNTKTPGPRSAACDPAGLAALAVLGLGLACGQAEQPEPHPLAVVVAPVVQQDVPVWREWVGTTQGFNNAKIRSQVKGYLLRRTYAEGSYVKQGQLLFEIDPREFEAQLQQARGTLGEARAMLGKSTLTVKRFTPLAAEGAVSQQELDDAVQEKLRDEASVLKARAGVAGAKLNVEWTRIVSPIGGIAGIAATQIGDLVSPSSELTTVSQVDPIKVEFPISESAYLRLARRRQSGTASSLENMLILILADGTEYPHRGTPYILGREVNPSTGTISIEGRFPNPERMLRPGQFARVRAIVDTLPKALLIPQRAIRDLQGSYEVAVVGADDTVAIRRVQVGEATGEDWVVTKGLKAGERVVVEGVQKVKQGMKVSVKPAPKATSSKASSKTESPAASTDASGS